MCQSLRARSQVNRLPQPSEPRADTRSRRIPTPRADCASSFVPLSTSLFYFDATPTGQTPETPLGEAHCGVDPGNVKESIPRRQKSPGISRELTVDVSAPNPPRSFTTS